MDALRDFTLHHIGVATRGIGQELPFFRILGYAPVTGVVSEPGQAVRGMFLTAPGQPTLELLENAGHTGPLDVPLARGIKLYHLAYEVPCVHEALDRLTALRAKVLVPPAASVCFREICFVMLPNLLLVELLKMGETSPQAGGI